VNLLLHHWTDAAGAGRIDVRSPVDLTERLLRRLAPFEKTPFERARAEGCRCRGAAP
jgi:hypothetical protein